MGLKIVNFKIFGIFLIFLGSGIFSIGIEWFAKSNCLVTGGVSGISIMIKEIFENLFGFSVSLSFLNILFNVPIFVFSFIVNGSDFVKKSLFGTLSTSFWLFVFDRLPNFFEFGNDILISAILTGIFCGLGIGLIFRVGASSGGTDMLANSLYKLFPQFPLPKILFCLDSTIILLGVFIFGVKSTVYSMILTFISSKLINNVLGGLRFAKVAFILSRKVDEISNSVFEILNRGNTEISCRGMYTKKEGKMLVVVVWPKEVVTLKEIVESSDPDAFTIICSAQEVVGKGFFNEKN